MCRDVGSVQQWVNRECEKPSETNESPLKLLCESSNNIDSRDPECLLKNTVPLGSVKKPKVAVLVSFQQHMIT